MARASKHARGQQTRSPYKIGAGFRYYTVPRIPNLQASVLLAMSATSPTEADCGYPRLAQAIVVSFHRGDACATLLRHIREA